MDINSNLIKIIYTTNLYNNPDYEYLTTILKNNYHKFVFLGKKRNYNENSKYSFQIEHYLENRNFMNNIWSEIQNLNRRNSILKKKKHFQKQYNLCNKKDENKNKDETKLICDNIEYNKEMLNNTKKVIKYYKNVYINSNLVKDKNQLKKLKRNGNNKRSSKYRGVSKNGIGWQVLMMFNNKKPYIGTYNSEELAARIYDIASIKKNGLKSKTNFIYNNEQIEKILKVNIDFKDKNISSIISEIIN